MWGQLRGRPWTSGAGRDPSAYRTRAFQRANRARPHQQVRGEVGVRQASVSAR